MPVRRSIRDGGRRNIRVKESMVTDQTGAAQAAHPPAAATISDVAERILTELAPAELATFPVICEDFFTRKVVHRQITRAVLRGRRATAPAAAGSAASQLLAEVLLVVLEKLAKDVLVPAAGRAIKWWRRRGRPRSKPVGAATPVPQFPAVTAARVGSAAKDIAIGAGLSEEMAQLLANKLAAELTAPPS